MTTEADQEYDAVPSVASKKRRIPGLGIGFTLIACFFFALGSIIVKLIADLGGISLSVTRFAVQFLVLLPIITHQREVVDILGPEGLRKVLWMRGLLGALCVPFLYLCVKRMDVGDAVTIAFTSTLMVPIVARIALKEGLTFVEIALGFISLIGVALIARPAFLFPTTEYKTVDGLGVLFGLLSAVCQALSMTTIRKLGKTSAVLSIAYFSICGFAISVPLVAVVEGFVLPCFSDLLYLFSIGIVGIIGQFFLTLGLRYERAATVGVTRSVQVIYAYVLQIAILGQIPTLLSLIGSSIIFLCCVTVGVFKVMKDRPKICRIKT